MPVPGQVPGSMVWRGSARQKSGREVHAKQLIGGSGTPGDITAFTAFTALAPPVFVIIAAGRCGHSVAVVLAEKVVLILILSRVGWYFLVDERDLQDFFEMIC